MIEANGKKRQILPMHGQQEGFISNGSKQRMVDCAKISYCAIILQNAHRLHKMQLVKLTKQDAKKNIKDPPFLSAIERAVGNCPTNIRKNFAVERKIKAAPANPSE